MGELHGSLADAVCLVVSSPYSVLQQLGVTLGHVILFDEPAPDVSVPTPLNGVMRSAGKVPFRHTARA